MRYIFLCLFLISCAASYNPKSKYVRGVVVGKKYFENGSMLVLLVDDELKCVKVDEETFSIVQESDSFTADSASQ